MSFCIFFSREDKNVFNAFKSILRRVESEYMKNEKFNSETWAPKMFSLLEKYYEIKIQRADFTESGYPRWTATFPNEQAYVWFMLRWA